ncbi:hypothetical protein MES5069_920004 [Mesorhizobium escarrei]|uniref:Insertion element IS150 protein InsJ-like helix-turn-helix domain-containing protein n=1 Tax=Mesorhizobium escarrei TaxID=666018 RepID=A0ABN8KLE6_9HYPH|nr:helix-turn-helix domain-containing protein [Mesorhizobium escarrei]CAH2409636.1 hypothetical protein MES5069_920004 [Mesorhizobium escarrei]
MKEDQREIQRKLRVLEHADVSGNVRKTCRYFGIGRASFYRWQAAYRRHGEHGLINKKPIPKNPANKTTPEIEEKLAVRRRNGRKRAIGTRAPVPLRRQTLIFSDERDPWRHGSPQAMLRSLQR